MLADLPLADLRAYRPQVAEPADFDEFWSGQIAAARAHETPPTFVVAASPVRHAQVYDVTFPGYGGDPIKGWLLDPYRVDDDAAMIVEFVGYGGGRGDPFDWLRWSCAGHPHLIMDCRGQGGGFRRADTPDPGGEGDPSAPGFMTRGIADPHGYFFTRLFTDAVRAVDAARTWPGAAGRPVAVTGLSQGGGLAIVAAHLAGDVAAVMPDAPFLAHPRRALEVTDDDPYQELARYCRVRPERTEQVFGTLSYVDVVNHARRASAPALFSVGLTDTITPPSTVFAAYNYYGGSKDIAVYPYNGHESGGIPHFLAQHAFVAAIGRSRTSPS